MKYTDLMIARLTFQQMCEKLEAHARETGIYIVRSYCRRTDHEQARMVETGASETMDSRHIYALAQDYVLLEDLLEYREVTDPADERWLRLGEIWESLGGVWGGRWETLQDAGHMEFWPFD